MATEVRYTLNMRQDKDTNTSITFAHIVDTPQEAYEIAKQDSEICRQYIAGWTEGWTDSSSSD